MSKHTPGPWKIDGTHIIGGDYAEKMVADVVQHRPGSADRRPQEAHAAANAALIAAAPDMYEALRFLRGFAFVSDGSRSEFTDAELDVFDTVWNTAEDALAKAEGR